MLIALIVCVASAQVAACSNFKTTCLESDAQCDGFRVWLAYQSVTPILLVGDSLGQVHVSYDGFAWRTITLNAGRSLKDMTFANGRFWAVTANPIAAGEVFYSEDAIAWFSTTTGVSNAAPMSGIAFGNGVYVATAEIGGVGDKAYSSVDGLNWTPNTDADLAAVDFAGVNLLNFLNDRFVGGDASGDAVLFSIDGLDWQIGLTSPSTGPQQFGAIAPYTFWNASGLLYSTTSITGPPPANVPGITGIRGVASNRFNFAAAVGDSSAIHTSTDGITWSGNLNPGGSAQLTIVTIEEPRLMLAGGANGAYYLSTNGGANWQGPFTIPGAGNLVTAITRPGYPFQ
ncbi:MAG: hypothetical protein RIF32_21265 [Leptospirales bacterium]